MQAEQVKQLAIEALEDLKAVDITVLDVRDMTGITDYMIIASATSSRHLKALADSVVEKAKLAGQQPMGVEGETGGEWALVDLGDAVVHIMMPVIRDLYQLEKLWSLDLSSAVDGEAK
jgi:ribosome-associated protein